MALEQYLERLRDGAGDSLSNLADQARNLAYTPAGQENKIANVPVGAIELAAGGTMISLGLIGRGKLGLAAGVVGAGIMLLGANNLFQFEKGTFDKISNIFDSIGH